MPRGTAVIDEDRCKGCGLCVAACPQKALALSGRLNRSGYAVAQLAKPDGCVGCAICAQTCPEVAIEVYREKGGPG